MTDILPPLAAIRVFEAAARHLSFTKAAAELGMTQAAVSYQIKLLEERVGTPLFLREGRQVVLTEAGRRLSVAATEAFDGLRAAFAAVHETSNAVLTLSASHALASTWLAPRLGAFQLAHPGLAVRLMASDRLTDFVREEVDAGLRSGHGPENMAIVKHMALNLMRSTKATASLKVRRKKAGWNTTYLGQVLRGAA